MLLDWSIVVAVVDQQSRVRNNVLLGLHFVRFVEGVLKVPVVGVLHGLHLVRQEAIELLLWKLR
jgi:hypothetical protein